MTPLTRWLRFNLVGASGIAVQLGSLTLVNRLTHGHYLFASAAAVELALLNNFAWHLRYTWKDRLQSARRLTQLVRFHLANGAVSLSGNLLLMRALVHSLHLRVLFANVCSIAVCSLLNFLLSDRWAFGQHQPQSATPLQTLT